MAKPKRKYKPLAHLADGYWLRSDYIWIHTSCLKGIIVEEDGAITVFTTNANPVLVPRQSARQIMAQVKELDNLLLKS